MITKDRKTFKVEFTTFFPRSPYIYIALEANDESHAQWVARNLCRFGYISNVTKDDGVAAFKESTHGRAYDEHYELYS